jgi:hypothetical protein
MGLRTGGGGYSTVQISVRILGIGDATYTGRPNAKTVDRSMTNNRLVRATPSSLYGEARSKHALAQCHGHTSHPLNHVRPESPGKERRMRILASNVAR